MKTTLLTIALFATLLFWSSCKEKNTEPLSTPEVIERIEMVVEGSHPPFSDTIILVEDTFYYKYFAAFHPSEKEPPYSRSFDTSFSFDGSSYFSLITDRMIDSLAKLSVPLITGVGFGDSWIPSAGPITIVRIITNNNNLELEVINDKSQQGLLDEFLLPIWEIRREQWSKTNE